MIKIMPIKRSKTSFELSNYNSFNLNLFRYKGTVINHVLPKCIFFGVWSTALFLLEKKLYKVGFLSVPNSIIAVLGTFISLLLVFRTNTAYDRYWEGRKVWSTMKVCLRNLARLTWLHCEEKDPKDRAIKEHIISLLISFAVYTKHHLRQEFDVDYQDCEGLMHNFPETGGTTPDSTINPFTRGEHDFLAIEIKESIRNNDSHSFPLIIIQRLSAFVAYQVETNRVNVSVQGVLINTLTTLTDCLTGFERILYTPIPTAYAVHLNQSLWIFCLVLPFQLLSILKDTQWVSIPFTILSTFVLFGILNIGEEIENPFGYDLNDLPLDDYCVTIRKELECICKLSSGEIMVQAEEGIKFNLVQMNLVNDKTSKFNKHKKAKRKLNPDGTTGTGSSRSTAMSRGTSSNPSTMGRSDSSNPSTLTNSTKFSPPQSSEITFQSPSSQHRREKDAGEGSGGNGDSGGGGGGGAGGGDD
jgi:putative membrane protein